MGNGCDGAGADVAAAVDCDFFDLYINGKEKVKRTGYSMKLLMLTLPLNWALIVSAPEVNARYCSYNWVMPSIS